MLFKYGTTREVYESASRFPKEVFTELLTGATVLDEEYGEDRDYTETGGYSVVVEEADDLSSLREIVNIATHPCEWAIRLGTSGFISSFYVFNNDFSIMLFIPESIAPPSITDEIQ